MVKSKYKSLTEWRKAYSSAYAAASRQGLIKEMCEYFGWELPVVCIRWAKADCLKHAKKFKSRRAWQNGHNKTYNAARLKGWLEDCCIHMEAKYVTWTKADCLEYAKKYKSKKAWHNGHNKTYSAARRNDWLEECSQHMDVKQITWVKEDCLEYAKKYTTRWAWQVGHSKTYNAAKRNGWLDECVKHMGKSLKKLKLQN